MKLNLSGLMLQILSFFHLQSKEDPTKALGITAEELKQLQEQAELDFNRIAMLDEQNQALQVCVRKPLGSYMSTCPSENARPTLP